MVSKIICFKHLGLGPEIIQNDAKTEHLEHLGGFGPEMVQNCTKTDHVEHVGGLGSEIVQNGAKTNALEPLTLWSL